MPVEGNKSYDIQKFFLNINQKEAFEYYTDGIEPEVLTNSPLRKDEHPSFSYRESNDGIYRYIDFASGEGGNIIDFIQKKYNLTFNEASNKILKDFKFSDKTIAISKKEKKPKKVTKIQIRTSIWNPFYLKYWFEYGISKSTLEHFSVFPITHYWVGGVRTTCKHSYAYKIFDRIKILNLGVDKLSKWKSNCSSKDWQGFEQLPDKGELLVITSSLKDTMVLYECGFTATAPPAETVYITKDMIHYLQKRFKQIIVLYDSDKPGIEAAKKLEDRLKLPYVFIKSHKDPSEYSKEFGILKTEEMLQTLIWKKLKEVK